MRSAWKPGSVLISFTKLASSSPPITTRTTETATSATTSEDRVRSCLPDAAPRAPNPLSAIACFRGQAKRGRDSKQDSVDDRQRKSEAEDRRNPRERPPAAECSREPRAGRIFHAAAVRT